MERSGYIKVSVDMAERMSFKKAIVRERPYYDRISISLAIRLAEAVAANIDIFSILDELDYLEGIKKTSRTKKEEPFRKPPLQGLWHKHFFSARHMIRNIGIRWNLGNGGNKDLSAMINEIARDYGDNPGLWQSMLADRLVMEGLKERAARGLTGDWIIYAKHNNANYYLDLATHEEGHDPNVLLTKLKDGCFAEFPFVFK